MVRVKRIYEPADPEDGVRVLVDRLWPRGVRKADAALDAWAKELAPSHELRRWYGHDPARFEAFARAYREELAAHHVLAAWRERARSETVTLLTATRDLDRSHAAVLADVLQEG